MDSELVSSSEFTTKSDGEGGGGSAPAPHLRFSDIFWQKFPYYLSIGMTEDQYWNGDCVLPKYYREAERLRQERVNQEAWLQGMYVYDGLLRASPILRAFVKKGTKPKPYVEEPYQIGTKTTKQVQTSKEKKTAQKGLVYMQTYMAAFNQRFNKQDQKKGSEINADTDRSPRTTGTVQR